MSTIQPKFKFTISWWFLAALASVVVFVRTVFNPMVIYSTQPSLPYLFYYKTSKAKLERAGVDQFVSFRKNHPNLGEIDLLKKVTCYAGENLKILNNKVHCNGELLGVQKKYALDGSKLNSFKWDGPVPPKKLFVTGTHKDSFDSRYFGFIDEKNIIYHAKPIL